MTPRDRETDKNLVWVIYAPEAKTYECSENNLPVTCTRLNQAVLESRYLTAVLGEVTFKVSIETEDGRRASISKTITVAAPYITGPGLAFTRGPVLPGLQSVTNKLAYGFEIVSSSKPMTSEGLSCKVNNAPVSCFLSGSYLISMSGTASGEGTYVASVTAFSLDGGESTETKTFTVDQTPPAIAVVGSSSETVAYDSSGMACFTVSVSVTGDATKWRYRVNGGSWSVVSLGTTSVSLCRYPGSYSIDVDSYDTAGNYAAVKTKTVTVVSP
jgi:hypothetical protein